MCVNLVNSFVPADSAELGITDKILTKLNTQESVSKVTRSQALAFKVDSLTNFLDPKHFHERPATSIPLPETSHEP